MADFTGDDRSDGLCVPETGRRSLATGDAAGTFKVGIYLSLWVKFSSRSYLITPLLISQAPIEDPNFPGFYNGTNDMMHVGDFDADGRKDLVCRMNNGGKYYIALTGKLIIILECSGYSLHK